MRDKRLENSVGGIANVAGGKEESEEDEKFFDAVEVSNDEWIKSKSVSFKPMGAEGVGEIGENGDGGKGGEAVAEQKFGHKRNTSAVSVNEAQLLLSSPEPDQLPVCPERTMSVGPGLALELLYMHRYMYIPYSR